MSVSNQVLKGILPSTRSKRDWVPRSDPRYRFLAGNGSKLAGCGVWMWRGCLEDHRRFKFVEGQLSLSGAPASDFDVVEAYKASCGRLACPVCYEKACAKLAIKIEHRISQFRIKGRDLRPIHVVVSPNETDTLTLDFPELRKKAYSMAMACGMIGGSIMIHPFRLYNEDDDAEDLEAGFSHTKAPASWYLSPHFHIIGYGWLHGTKENYEKTGWVVKNLRVRHSVRATAHYQLSHCGVNERFHTVVWFGALAYNKLKVKPLPAESHPCPVCDGEFRRIEFKDRILGSIVESKLEREEVFYVTKGLFQYAKGRVYDGG